MSNLLLFIGGLLAIVLGGLFAVPHYVDWNSYRGLFEEEATRILGREVRVRGSVSLRLLPRPYVSFEKIRIADSRSGTGGAFFGAESFTMWLAVPPLLQGAFEANQIEIQRPILRLRLDKEGGGNWEGLGPKQGTTTLLPKNVALDKVKIIDGQVRIVNDEGGALFQLDAINGTFAAPSLQGPFKLRAMAKYNGREREIRMSTSKRRDDGSLRLRGTVRLTDSGSSYTFDGQIKDALQHPRLTGTVLARLWTTPAEKAPSTPIRRGHPIEMKASVQADALSAKLSDITISLEHDGKPQLLTGKAEMAWKDGQTLSANLEARWLDLDRIGSGKTPFATIHTFLTRLGAQLPTQGRSHVAFKVDQANLGADVVSALHLAVSKLDGEYKISDLSASTPGGSRIILAGVLSGSADTAIFDGRLRLRGASLDRFARWALKDPKIEKTTNPIHFDLNTDILAAADSLSARRFELEFAKSRLTGTGRYHWGNFASLALSFNAGHLDISPFMTKAATLADVKKLLGLLGKTAAPTGKSKPETGAGLAAVLRHHALAALANAQIRAQVGRLTMAGSSYHDVNIDLTLTKGKLALTHLIAVSDDGLSLDVRGEIEKVATEPKGRLGIAVSAADAKAVERLAMLLNMPAGPHDTVQRVASLAPLRLAGGIDLGFRLPKAADIDLHGSVRDGQLSLSLHMDGGFNAPQKGHIELTGDIKSRDAATLMAQLIPASSGRFPTEKEVGRFTLRASGVPENGMTSALSVQSALLKAAFTGTTRLAESRVMFDGDLVVTTADARNGAALIGLALPGVSRMPLQGRSTVVGDAAGINISRLRLQLAGTSVRGEGSVRAKGAKHVVTANLKTSSADLRELLAIVQGRKVEPATTAGGESQDIATIWTNAPFDFTALASIEGTVHLAADVLKLSPGLNLRAATLIAKLTPGTLQLANLKGTAIGGQVQADLKVSKTPGGASLTGSFAIDKARLERLVNNTDGKPAVHGLMSVSLNLTGSGLSLRGIAGVLQGKGQIKIGDVSLRRLTPSAVSDAAEAFITGKVEEGTLAALIASKLDSGQLQIPAQTISVTIRDGSLTARPIKLDSPRARVVSANALDLTSLTIDSKWDIAPKTSSVSSQVLPSVRIFYSGPIGALDSLEPKILAAALEREIAVRRLEFEAGELERLRKVDEDRAERQRVRLEKLRLERQQREREVRAKEAREQLDRERLGRERLQRERLERVRLVRERLERMRLARERLERERLQKKLKPPAPALVGPGIARPDSTGPQWPGTQAPSRRPRPRLKPPPLQLPGSSGLLRARPQ